MERTFICQLCLRRESWTTERAAQSAGVWHIYFDHHDTWLRLLGYRLPQNPPPTDLGRQLEAWESQL